MRRVALLAIALCCGTAWSEEAPQDNSLAARVNRAIDNGVAWLKKRQQKDGSFGPCVSSGRYDDPTDRARREAYRIGPTAFSVFTLRKCGVPRTDKTVTAALKWLKKHARRGWTPDTPRTEGTQFYGKGRYRYTSYESAAVVMMLVELNKKDLRPGKKPKPVRFSKAPDKPARGWKRDEWEWMHERIQFLIANPHPRMPPAQSRNGGWRYWSQMQNSDQDLSATQFALLGLRAAVRGGYPVHLLAPSTWEQAARAAGSFQLGNGAFFYHRGEAWSAGMTAAGIASLIICKEQILNLGLTPPNDIDDKIKAGFQFLGEQIDFAENKTGNGRGHYHYYYLYGIERLGSLSGKREIGGKSWYPRGAEWLVGQQKQDGQWHDDTCMEPKDVLGTCFALLFLKKATIPAVTVSGR